MADLWWLMLGLGVAVFVVFAVVLGVGLLRRPAQHRFDRWLIGGGAVLPTLVIAVVFGATLHAMRAVPTTAPSGALAVEVIGHQWWWEVRYPGAGVTTANELHIPLGRPVTLQLSSADVIHSFWVPALAGKLDLLPDHTNELTFEADMPGEHVSRCAEFCGLQHTQMRMIVVAEPAERFASWLAGQQRPAAEPVEAVARRGRDVFLAAGCASCHAIRGVTGETAAGPDLTHIASRRSLGAAAVPNTPDRLAQWVTDPHTIKQGVKMPAAELTPEQRHAVLTYLGGLQ